MKRKWSLKKRIQCRQTGLSHSYSRWVIQFAALISTGPVPASAQASWTPSSVRTYRIRWLALFIIERHFPRPNGTNVPGECLAVYPNRDETPIARQRRKPHHMRQKKVRQKK